MGINKKDKIIETQEEIIQDTRKSFFEMAKIARRNMKENMEIFHKYAAMKIEVILLATVIVFMTDSPLLKISAMAIQLIIIAITLAEMVQLGNRIKKWGTP